MVTKVNLPELVSNIITKGAVTAAGIIAKPATTFIMEKFLQKFRVQVLKYKGSIKCEPYCESKEMSEIVCEWVMQTIHCAFEDRCTETVKLLFKNINGNHESFKNHLIDIGIAERNHAEFNPYVRIISELVDEIYKPDTLEKYLVFLNENQRDVLNFEMIGEILTLISMMKNSTEDKLDLILSILTDNYKLSAPEITDRNIEYIRDYYEPLFLEEDGIFSEGCTDNIALLEDAFVEPMLSYRDNLCSVIDTLKAWAANTDRRKRGMNAKIFLLYGKAGDGKTSLVSHILAKNILGEKCHAIALRNHLDTLAAENENKWELLKECFKKKNVREMLDDEEFSGKVLILDGLDEVCVLRQHFNGNTFIRGLMSDAPSDVKILITSRNGNYFKDVGSCNDVTTGTLQWTEGKVKEWCGAYKAVHSCRAEWCDKLPDKLKSKEEKFRNALSTPIILYICCVRNIDISTENSIAGIYDEAFNKIGKRAFNEHPNFKEADRKQHEVNWQYTKELAFQMFLNGTLEEVVAVDGMNDFAKERTRTILKEKHKTDAYEKIEPEFKKYFAVCPFVSKKGERGVEFAHKTVGEYFTAVKLYEDYFGKLFQNGEQTDDETVWKTIFQAFRYNDIPEDIIDYLVDITEKDNNKAWKEKLFRSFHKGMAEQYFWKALGEKQYYQSEEFKLANQVYQAFANLTWYFTKLGFAEYDRKHYKYTDYFATVISSYINRNIKFSHINCSNWECLYYIIVPDCNLIRANLIGTDLMKALLNNAQLIEANLNGANLNDADLIDANLIRANLSSANLSSAYLNSANLGNANLCSADLNGADLSGADLSYADLRDADLRGAKLNRIKLWESDLPKWTEPLHKALNKLIDPIVYDDETGKPITDRIYNPKTNRMEYPKDKPKGD